MNNRLYGNLIFELSKSGRRGYSLPKNNFGSYEIPKEICRATDAALPECDELTVVRHYTNLSNNNFGVDTGFYPLGSCTMKYNPKINEEMAALPQFQNLHPSQPAHTVTGAQALVTLLEKSLCALTGLAHFTFKPYAGAHGELTGLMTIDNYHRSRGDQAGKRSGGFLGSAAHRRRAGLRDRSHDDDQPQHPRSLRDAYPRDRNAHPWLWRSDVLRRCQPQPDVGSLSPRRHGLRCDAHQPA